MKYYSLVFRVMKISNIFSLQILLLLVLISCNETPKESRETASDFRVEQTIDPLAKINKQLSKDSENDQLYIERARHYLSIGETDSAFRDIFVAIDINGQEAGHYATLSDAYLVLGKPDKCKDALDKALAIDPNNKLALQKLAELYLIVKDYDKTYETINTALQSDSYNPTIYFIRGLALLEQSDSLAAVEAFKMASYQDQNFFDAYFQLGLIFMGMNDPLAIEYFNTSINLQPENILPYYHLGLYYQENGHIQKALSTYQIILDMQSKHVNSIYNMGYIYLVYIQDFELAIDYFTMAIELEPSYAEAYYNRGYAYEMLGNTSMARGDYMKTLEIKTNYPKAVEALNRLDN